MGANPQSHLQQQLSMSFEVGSLVEIQSTEEDYKGIAFLATVISPKNIIDNKPQILVEYHNLLARDDGSEDLFREYVDISWVTPVPPLEEEPETGFQLGDIVDAFFNDGWWKGVVEEFVGEKIVVTFEDPPDEREFMGNELRVHWDWVDGSWCRSVNKNVVDSMFDVGKKIEVSFLNSDAWFPANVCKTLENGSLLIEYSSKGNDEEANVIKKIVDSLHVRPRPPLLKDISFALLDKVDAYFDFGWWKGSVAKVLEGGMYLVVFKQTKSVKELSQSELRPQMECKNGKWITTHQTSQKIDAVNTSGDRMDTSDGTSLISVDTKKRVELSTSVTQKLALETKKNLTLSDYRPQPLKQPKEGNKVGPSLKDTPGGSIKEKFSSISLVPIANIICSATQSSTGNHSSGNPSSGMKKGTGPCVFKEHFAMDKKVRNQRKVDDILNDAKKVDSKLGTAMENMTQVLYGKETVKPVSVEEHELHGSANMKSEGGDLSRTGELSRKRKATVESPKTVRDDFTTNDGDLQKTLELGQTGMEGSLSNKVDKLSETGETSVKRKRGRPCRVNGTHNKENVKKLPVDSVSDPLLTLALEAKSQADATLVVGSNGDTNKVSRSQPDTENMEVSSPKEASLSEVVRKNMFEETLVVIDLIMQQEGIERTESVGEGSPLELFVASESPRNDLDEEDVPISRWNKGSHTPPSPPPPITDGTNKGKGTASIDTTSVDLPLPFLKTPYLWKMVESVDVFQRIPQTPHFKPLEHLNASAREGAALGLMMTFSTVVDRISKLKYNDVDSSTNDILQTLADLETHGFEVGVVCKCVSKLLEVKIERERLMHEMEGLNAHLSVEKDENSTCEKEIHHIVEEIEKLKTKLDSAKATKSKSDDKIGLLTVKLRENEGGIKAKLHEFHSISKSVLM